MGSNHNGKADSGEELLFEIFLALQNNRIEEAQDLLQRLPLAKRSRKLGLWPQLLAGELKLKQGAPEAAQELLLTTRAKFRKNQRVENYLVDMLNYLLGCAYYEQGDYVQAYQLHISLLLKPQRRRQSMKLFNSLGMELIVLSNNYESALAYFRRALALAQELKAVQEHARACLGSAICYKNLGNFNYALIHARQGLELLSDSPAWELRAKLHNVMAETLLLKEHYRQAEIEFKGALYCAEKAGDPRWLSMVYSGRAQLLALQGDLVAARRIIAQAEAISPARNAYLAYGLARFAGILITFGYFEEAEETFKRGLTYVKDEAKGGIILSLSYYIYGVSLSDLGQNQQAMYYLKQALELKRVASQLAFAG
jgi:tetratricopeptide (TPR) repeat protein